MCVLRDGLRKKCLSFLLTRINNFPSVTSGFYTKEYQNFSCHLLGTNMKCGFCNLRTAETRYHKNDVEKKAKRQLLVGDNSLRQRSRVANTLHEVDLTVSFPLSIHRRELWAGIDRKPSKAPVIASPR